MKRWINCMIWFLAATHLPSLEAFGDNNGNFTRDEKMSIFNVVRKKMILLTCLREGDLDNVVVVLTRWSSPTVSVPPHQATMELATGIDTLAICDHRSSSSPSTSSLPSSSSSECEAAGGTASGTCASSFGVCCVFRSPLFVKQNPCTQLYHILILYNPTPQHCLRCHDEPEQLLRHHQQLLNQVHYHRILVFEIVDASPSFISNHKRRIQL